METLQVRGIELGMNEEGRFVIAVWTESGVGIFFVTMQGTVAAAFVASGLIWQSLICW